MPCFNLLQRLSQAPTQPSAAPAARQFDVAELYQGPIGLGGEAESAARPFDEKLRQASFWIVNHVIISPHYDIEYNDGPSQTYAVGDSRRTLSLPSAQSHASFIRLPLLTFATRRKCLFVGGPGRVKTASALLMGVLADLLG